MICVSIQNKEFDEIQRILEEVEMAEIRLDRCALDDEEIERLFQDSDVPLIATCRLSEEPGAPEILERAIRAGAKYADLEMEAPAAVGRRIREACREYGTVLIRSYHNFEETPSLTILRSLAERARSFGGEVVKIVTTANSKADVETIEALYGDAAPGSLVAFAMGEVGRVSRLDALRLGAPFTYASLAEGEESAPGQWSVASMKEAVYGNFRFVKADGLRMPSSKSFAQRAIVAAALASGTSHLEGYTPCSDNESAIAAASAIGAKVALEGSTLVIEGIGAAPGCIGIESLHTGESGFLTRLMIPVLSAISDTPVRVTGEKTLLSRPLSDAHDIMAAFGVRLYPEEGGAARKNDCYLPLTVAGPLISGRAEVSGKGGSQLISGLLCALPLCGEKSALYVEDPRSIPYLFITVDVLKKFGIRMNSEVEGGEDFLETGDWNLATGVNFRIRGGQRYAAADFSIEADWSGAAAFLAAGAIFGEVEVEGLDTESLQADISIMDILLEAGASLSQTEGTGGIHVQRAPLCAFRTDLNNCPDLFPVVAVVAAFCPGESHILGAGRLRHKETDRAGAIAEMLSQMGVPVRVEEDEMIVEGIGLTERILSGKLLKGGKFTSHGDHRMVMALRLAALGASSPVEIDDIACVAKSFPSFNELFDRL